MDMNSKSVVIAEPDPLTPTPSPDLAPMDADHPQLCFSPNQHRTNASRRLSGRLPEKQSPSLHSIPSLTSLESIPAIDLPVTDPEGKPSTAGTHHRGASQENANRMISQVAEWLEQEKARRVARKAGKHTSHRKLEHATNVTIALTDHFRTEDAKHQKPHHVRRDSDLSESGLALEKLEQILSEGMIFKDGQAVPSGDRRDSSFVHRRPSRKESAKKLMRRNSTVFPSDSEHPDNELLVPSTEVALDNSKVCRDSGGAALSEVDLINPSKHTSKEKAAWKQFKTEIATLTHTLKISGWRRVPIERSGEIDIERLSGALTNSVYVVSPPKNLPQTPAVIQVDGTPAVPKKPPPKLLLRIYGSQVENLIDHESELRILRRLARRRIGPRLLGTFTNGRFEQFFYAKTLTALDLRVPETSKQIAKRMRELHDGIDLLKEERESGPFVWRNWDKWVDRCEDITLWLDHQVISHSKDKDECSLCSGDWKNRGFVCGVEWPLFRQTVNVYRKWLLLQYGNTAALGEQLVFAHNDTQYGNLLRLEPSGESPLLLPANEHKQLVVIDFEYASANLPGLEFANHFTEWCYNYHNPTSSHVLNEKAYPTPEEQYRFLKAYIQHHPPVQPHRQQSDFTSCTTTPTLRPRTISNLPSNIPPSPSGTNNIINNPSVSYFNLDNRLPPPVGGYAEEERQREEALQAEIERLKHETRLWRVANSAQWVAWGIMQAKVRGMDQALEQRRAETTKGDVTPTAPVPKPESESADSIAILNKQEHNTDSSLIEADPNTFNNNDHDNRGDENDDDDDDDDDGGGEFDYLAYAQQRALLFWGDVLQLGLVRLEDLPEGMRDRVKVVEY